MTLEHSISIIIPCYNAGKYLPRCLASILEQTYRNFEVIIVDDGSTDNTEEVVRTYLEKYPFFRYFRQNNGGPGIARNTGITYAKGEWTTFIDADDYVEKDFLEVLLKFALENDLHIAACGMVFEKSDLSFNGIASNPQQVKISYTGEVFEDLLNGNMYAGVVTMKLIKTRFLKGVPFPAIKYGEDSLFLARITVNTILIGFTPYVGYHYVRVEDSATMNVSIPESVVHLDHIWVWREIFFYRAAMEEKGIRLLSFMYAKTIYQAITSLAKENNRAKYDEKSDFLRDNILTCIDFEGVDEEHAELLRKYLASPDDCWAEMTQE